MSSEYITKLKKLKIALPERKGNNFYRLCEKFKAIEHSTNIEEYLKLYKPMTETLSSMLAIMENGHVTDPGDIKDISIVKLNHKEDIEVSYNRYRQCKLQPILVIVSEFKKGVVEIEPSIQSISHF